MPYKKVSDLPKPIQAHLPLHAQKIYLESFNNAFERYDDEETVIKVAWSAVKKVYKKGSDGKWVKK